ncbi:glycosyltransferase family 1 protein [Cellulosimicrobium cellulans]|uniref:glycosyltransferase family 1 protein n=1 Tax=Cellulosimicrobium cellulans TaxID=1710 RepID=UPI002098673C|nr:glycosyltransferase family 1 protein [Cellulosimicrobium cellulans]MCO7274286.1 glycosyltransferase family 1 protein [Cellulosimicrobium cellulans]
MTDELLILSFSRLEQDARLRRQIALFAERYHVVTAGWGPPVPGAERHIELPVPPSAGWRRRARFYVEALLLRLRAYRLLYWSQPSVRSARRVLRRERPGRVLANDIDSLPLALWLAPGSSVHGDLHEFYPGLHDDNPRWVRVRKPYLEWLIRRYAPRVGSLTTVGESVAEAYRPFGLEPGVVTNSPAYVAMEPTPLDGAVRIVHPGASLRSRRLENMVRAVASSTADVRLTLFLTGNDPAYVAELRTLAEGLGGRVRVEDAVPHDELLAVVNSYDVGIHVLPPTVTNNALALPNKFFDYVQARVGVVVGPTPAMAGLVREHGLGAVTDGFDADAIRAVVDELTPERVAGWKRAAAAAARELSAEAQLPVWLRAVEGLPSARASH